MTYLIWFPYQGGVVGVVNEKEQAERLARLINTARTGTDAPVAEVLAIPVIDLRLNLVDE